MMRLSKNLRAVRSHGFRIPELRRRLIGMAHGSDHGHNPIKLIRRDVPERIIVCLEEDIHPMHQMDDGQPLRLGRRP